jgi:hypothetical protein
VRVTSRANKAAFHEKSASEPAIFCASVLAPRPWEWEKGPLAHSLLAGVQQQQPNQPSRSARFHRHRLLSSFLPAATPGGNGRFRLQRKRPGGRGGVRLFVPPPPPLMDGQRRPRFFKVLVGDFARRIVSSPPSSSCCRDPVRSPLSRCLHSRPW